MPLFLYHILISVLALGHDRAEDEGAIAHFTV